MKIDYLILTNIGPFSGTTKIDFSSLGDVFLICGKTGSGKSTIFDAVTFSLYGKMPGVKKTVDNMRLRSDFCTEKDEAFVTLDFTVGSASYRARRTLPYKYITRNGTESSKDSEILIYKKSSPLQDASVTLISDKTKEANKYIESLIGLSHEEFGRIVLLPQGEFAEFLKQNSNDRRASLAKLFPVELYTSIIEKAKVKADDYKKRLDAVQQTVDVLESGTAGASSSADGLDTQTVLQQLEDEKAAAAVKRDSLSAQTLEYARQKDALQNKLDDVRSLELYYSQRSSLEAQAGRFASLADKLVLGEKAAAVQKYIEDDERCAREYTQALEQKKAADTRRTAAQQRLAALKSRAAAVEEKKQQSRRIELCIHDLQSASEAQTNLNKVRQTLAQLKKDSAILTQKIETISAQHDELEKALASSFVSSDHIAALTDAERNAADASRTAEEMLLNARNRKSYQDKIAVERSKQNDTALQITAEENALAAVRANIEKKEAELVKMRALQSAPQLALLLRENEPCPVCGSLHHPHPADQAQDDAALQGEIETLKRICDAAEKNLPRLQKELTNIESTIRHNEEMSADIDRKYPSLPSSGAALEQLNSAKEAHKKAQESLKTAQAQAADREKKIKDRDNFAHQLRPLADEQTKLSSKISALLAEETAYRVSIEQTQIKHQNVLAPYISGIFDARALFTALSHVLDENKKEAEAYTQECEQAEREGASSAQLVMTISQRAQETKEQQEKSHNLALLNVQNNNFSSIEEARSSLVTSQEKATVTAQIEAYRQEKTASAARISETEKRLAADKKEIQCDALRTQLETSIAEYVRLSQNAARETAELQKHIDDVSSRIQAIISRREALEKARTLRDQISAEAQKYLRLYAELSGKNPRQTVFDSWVLGMYLEEVTVFASRRLERISEGRYTLHLNEGVTGGRDKYRGLDLEIFDSYTGKRRPCSTLSGGETFMTSISLALALSDVVQSHAGGVQLDSLFIDEGFGSLDEATLEKAMSILDEIRGTRCVGLISHVGDLKSRIPSRIEIDKSRRGSTVTIHT